jgi:hypothetical protein
MGRISGGGKCDVPEISQAIIALLDQGKPASQIAKQLGLNQASVYRFRDRNWKAKKAAAANHLSQQTPIVIWPDHRMHLLFQGDKLLSPDDVAQLPADQYCIWKIRYRAAPREQSTPNATNDLPIPAGWLTREQARALQKQMEEANKNPQPLLTIEDEDEPLPPGV